MRPIMSYFKVMLVGLAASMGDYYCVCAAITQDLSQKSRYNYDNMTKYSKRWHRRVDWCVINFMIKHCHLFSTLPHLPQFTHNISFLLTYFNYFPSYLVSNKLWLSEAHLFHVEIAWLTLLWFLAYLVLCRGSYC